MAGESNPLLAPDFLRRLDRLKLQTRRVLSGQLKGERLTRRKGVSIDFADYRQYARGDDLRFIDWNIYGRLDRLFIKLYYEEQDLQCHLLVDTSKSMAYGDPSKFEFARRLAAAIAYVGLSSNDKAGIACFAEAEREVFAGARGRHHVRRMLSFLNRLQPAGETSLQSVCKQFAQRVRSAGIVVLISDFLDPAGFEPALRHLVRENLDVYIIHVLAPQELEPNFEGHLELHDLETDHTVEITLNPRLKEVYRHNVEAFCSMIENYSRRHGFAYSLVSSDEPMEEVILKRLRRDGLVRL